MIFSYLPLPTKAPIPSLGGASVRHRPIVPIRIIGPTSSRILDGCIDSGSDDVIFPSSVARKIGVDLTGAAMGAAHPVGGAMISYLYAKVVLRLTNGQTTFEWPAVVGFVDQPLRWALLGHASFLEYFDVELRGERRETIILPNGRFP